MGYSREKFVKQMQSYLGAKKGDAKHKAILNTYNSQAVLPRGYKMTVNDPWCATTVSAASIALGYTNIIPTECSCGKMITKMKALGIWVEDDNYQNVKAGDIIFYSWKDNGVGDCTTGNDHVGVIETVVGDTLTVIEGNYSKECKRRIIKKNGQYIRGFGVPKFDDDAEEVSTTVQDDKAVWDLLYSTIGNEYGVAGIMGNLKAESGIRSNNLQDCYNKSLSITDEKYTDEVNKGQRSFLDNRGYGIAQWTINSRKKSLMSYMKSKGAPIQSLEHQVKFLLQELETSYKNTLKVLKTAKTVKEASNRFLIYYEAPAQKNNANVQNLRATYGEEYYTKYASSKTFEEYYVVVKGDSLSKIAKKYGITLNTIKKLNPDVKAPLYTIKVGQEIRVK